MIAVLIALLTSLGAGASEGLDPSFARTLLTVRDGVPTNSVTALAYDDLGFLMVGTTGGLARYDGATFETLYSSDHDGLDGDRILALYQDRAGGTWVGAERAPACVYRNGAFERIGDVATLHSIHQIYESSNGAIWIAGNRLGRIVEGTLEVFGEEHGLVDNTIRRVLEDEEGNLWVGTDIGVFSFDGSEFTLFDPRASRWITHDFNGEIWSQTYTGSLIPITDQAHQPMELGDARIQGELEHVDHTRLVATDAGLYGMFPRDSELGTGLELISMAASDRQTEPARALTCLLSGPGNDLWVGTGLRGLQYVERRFASLVSLVEDQPGVPVFHVHQLKNGRALINGGDQLTAFILEGNGQRMPVQVTDSNDYHSRFVADTEDVTWLSTRGGLARLNGTEIIPIPEWRRIGGVMVAGPGDSVWMNMAGRFERVVGKGPGISGLETPSGGISAACMYQGSIVVATPGQLLRLDTDAGAWIPLANIGDARIRQLRPDPTGDLWMSSYGQGLLRLDPSGRVDQWSRPEGLPDPFLAWIAPVEGDGHLWISSNSGVLRVLIASLDAHVAGTLNSIDVRTFGAPEANGARGAVLADGIFALPTMAGLAIFDRSLIPPPSDPPRALIAAPFINGVPIENVPNVFGRANLLFRFTAPIFPSASDALFQYRMIELDERWTDAGSAREVPFPSLPSGQYTFEVRARTPTSDWSTPARSATIRIPPYWYDRTWVRWLLIVAILLAIHQLVLLRTRPLADRNSLLSDEIDQRLIAESRLQTSEQRFRQLFHTAPSAIIAWTTAGELLDRNERANSLFAWGDGDSIQKLPWSLFEDEELGRRVFDQVLEKRDDLSVVAMARAGDFGHKRCRWQFAPTLNEAGEITSIIAMISDLSRQDRDAKDLADLRESLVRAEESERSRIARELHDDLSQRLAALALDAHMVEQGAPYAMGSFRSKIEGIATHVHTLSRQLHPTIVDDLGLVMALRSECTRRDRTSRASVTLVVEENIEPPPRDTALALFRIAQESMSNAARHSGASHVRVHLGVLDEEWLELTIEDDGEGFDSPSTASRGGIGMNSMRERARLAGGDLYVESSPGEGTSIVARVPRNADAIRRAKAMRGE